MNAKKILAAAALLVTLTASQQGQDSGAAPKTLSECVALAHTSDDSIELAKRPASEINELDWKLSVCEGKFTPLKRIGATEILYAHGTVADEMRMRLEKAIKTLPEDQQAKVWDAFHADRGTGK
jgi:hypothetical protein